MATEPLTAETVTDEQIHEIQRSIQGRVFPASGMAHTELSEIYETCTLALYGGTWDPPSPRHDARAAVAAVITARRALADRRCSACCALCDHESWDGTNCPWCINARRAQEGK